MVSSYVITTYNTANLPVLHHNNSYYFYQTILSAPMNLSSSKKLTFFLLLRSSVQPSNLPGVSISRMINIWFGLKNSRYVPLSGLSIIWPVYIFPPSQ